MQSRKTLNHFITDETIMNCIYVLRGEKVMMDLDLAELYQVDVTYFYEEVSRNAQHFPDDFIIELNDDDFCLLWRQNSALSCGLQSRRVKIAFTERAIPMLSCILNGELVARVNHRIIRIFYLLRQILDRCCPQLRPN